MTGTDLASIQRIHQLRRSSRVVVRPGGEAILDLPRSKQEELTVTIAGTVYPVFVVGLHNPDDLTMRYVV